MYCCVCLLVGKVTAKEFGKSKVYFPTQSDKDASPDEMTKVDKQLTEVDIRTPDTQ